MLAFHMASFSTSSSQSGNLLHQLLMKHWPFEPSGMKTLHHDIAERIRRNEDEIISVVFVGFSETNLRDEFVGLLEFLSFYLKLSLRRIKLISDEDSEKYTSLQDLEQAILSAHKATKEYKYSICKEYYKDKQLQKNYLQQKERLKNALSIVREEKQKSSFEMTEQDFIRLESPTARLCSVLGLKLDSLDYLDEMPKEHSDHRKLSEWIEIILEDNSLSLLAADKNTLTEKLLESLGFDPLSTAVESIMMRSFQESRQQHIEACEWAQIFIKDEFKYNPLLSPPTAKLPFPSHFPRDTWVELPNVPGEEIESNINLSNVYIRKLVTEEAHACSKTQSALSGFIPQDEQNIVLYHGTDHESAHQILLRGIYLCAGRQKRDFSCGKGFYLTNRMEGALNWAKSATARPAILTFVVNRKELDKARKLNLTLNENKEKWREIVSSFRTAKRTAATLESLCSFDLIEGPMATVSRNESSDELVFEPKPSSYQICLISDDFAEKFEQTLHSIVFFDIS